MYYKVLYQDVYTVKKNGSDLRQYTLIFFYFFLIPFISFKEC